MQIKILSPLWGRKHLPLETFLEKIKDAGYDGIDTWLPDDPLVKKKLLTFIDKHELILVAHQHKAAGSDFKSFRSSFTKNLMECAEVAPALINSHTGKDYFTLEQNLVLIDTASEISAKTGVEIVHETHRGRLGYCPQAAEVLFQMRPDLKITADLSHWVCVTESMLENFSLVLANAIARTRHVHARIGYEEGPQVPDPRIPEWAYALNNFLKWWDGMVETNQQGGQKLLTFTTEFGPFPYMVNVPATGKPIADQFEVNCFMKDLLKERYASYL